MFDPSRTSITPRRATGRQNGITDSDALCYNKIRYRCTQISSAKSLDQIEYKYLVNPPKRQQRDAAGTPSASDWDLWFPDAYEISSETVRSFARATRNPHIPHQQRSILDPDTTSVPLTLLAAPMFDAAAALVSQAIPNCNLSRIVHATQQFTALDTLHIGQRISLGARLASHIVKASTDIISIDVTAYSADIPKLAAVITIAHSATAGPAANLDTVANQIMLTGTGPSDSDAYTNTHRTGQPTSAFSREHE